MEVYQTELRDMLDAARREPKRARDQRDEAPQERPPQRARTQEAYEVIEID